MKILDLSMFDNLSSKDLTAEQLKMSLAESGTYLRDLVVSSTNEGNSFDQVERAVFQALKKIGFGAMELLIRLQGTGDLGVKISSAEGSLTRNSKQSIRHNLKAQPQHNLKGPPIYACRPISLGAVRCAPSGAPGGDVLGCLSWRSATLARRVAT